MHCPSCKSRNLITEPVLKCNDCSYEFVLNPSLSLLWSDSSIHDLAENTKESGTSRYTLEGLLFQAMKENRKSRATNRIFLIISLVLVLFSSDWFSWGFIPLWLTLILSFGPFTFWAMENTKLNKITKFTDLRKAMELWVLSKNSLPGFLTGSENSVLETLKQEEFRQSAIIVKDKLTQQWLIENGLSGVIEADIISLEDFNVDSLKNDSETKIFLLEKGVSEEIKNHNAKFIGLSESSKKFLVQKFSWEEKEFPIHALPYKLVEDKLLNSFQSGKEFHISTSEI